MSCKFLPSLVEENISVYNDVAVYTKDASTLVLKLNITKYYNREKHCEWYKVSAKSYYVIPEDTLTRNKLVFKGKITYRMDSLYLIMKYIYTNITSCLNFKQHLKCHDLIKEIITRKRTDMLSPLISNIKEALELKEDLADDDVLDYIIFDTPDPDKVPLSTLTLDNVFTIDGVYQSMSIYFSDHEFCCTLLDCAKYIEPDDMEVTNAKYFKDHEDFLLRVKEESWKSFLEDLDGGEGLIFNNDILMPTSKQKKFIKDLQGVPDDKLHYNEGKHTQLNIVYAKIVHRSAISHHLCKHDFRMAFEHMLNVHNKETDTIDNILTKIPSQETITKLDKVKVLF